MHSAHKYQEHNVVSSVKSDYSSVHSVVCAELAGPDGFKSQKPSAWLF